jgi:hypothetical protein
MYLVDTSVWISYLRQERNNAVDYLMMLLDKKASFGISSLIYQEIIQGAHSKKDLLSLIKYFTTQLFYHPEDSIQSYQAAAEIYFNCRSKGITIRSTIDCIIAQIAIENDLLLLHNDKDFIQIKKVTPKLQLVEF